MSVNLQKGQKISLSKESRSGLGRVIVGLGWDEAQRAPSGGLFGALFASAPASIDCDAFALLLKNGHLVDNKDIVYFGNLTHHTRAVQHMGDNLTGAGDGDDEQIIVDVTKIPADYDRIIFGVNIYQARQRSQHFGMIQNAFIRLVDGKTNSEMCIYNLSENYSGNTAMFFGEMYKNNGEWKFAAVGQGTADNSIGEFAKRFL